MFSLKMSEIKENAAENYDSDCDSDLSTDTLIPLCDNNNQLETIAAFDRILDFEADTDDNIQPYNGNVSMFSCKCCGSYNLTDDDELMENIMVLLSEAIECETRILEALDKKQELIENKMKELLTNLQQEKVFFRDDIDAELLQIGIIAETGDCSEYLFDIPVGNSQDDVEFV